MHVHGKYVYVVASSGLSSTIERVPQGGGSAERVFTSSARTCVLGAAGSLAADDAFVYFGCFVDQGMLVRAKIGVDPDSPVETVAKLSRKCTPANLRLDDDAIYFVAGCAATAGMGPLYRVPLSGVTFPVDALNLSALEPFETKGTRLVPRPSDSATVTPCTFTERCEGNTRQRCRQLRTGPLVDSFACRAPNSECVMSDGHAVCVHGPPTQNPP